MIYHENGIYSIKLADFGISKDLNAKMIFSTANAPGTPGWIAPEVRRAGHVSRTKNFKSSNFTHCKFFNFKTNLSDVFSLGAVFYYVCVGNMLSNELGLDYIGVDDLLITKVQSLANGPGNNNQIMQMDLLRRMLKLKPELRPSVKKVLHHPLFWDDKRCLDIILQIRKKFDILDPNFIRKIRNDHQKVLDDTPLVQNLKDMLDVDKAVVHNDWIIMLDKVLADEFKKGYDKKSVSDLLRAMRNKVIIPLNSIIIFIY